MCTSHIPAPKSLGVPDYTCAQLSAESRVDDWAELGLLPALRPFSPTSLLAPKRTGAEDSNHISVPLSSSWDRWICSIKGRPRVLC